MWLWQERKRAEEKMSVQLFAGNTSIWRAMTTTILAKRLDCTNLLESCFPRTEVKTLLQLKVEKTTFCRVSYVDPFEFFHCWQWETKWGMRTPNCHLSFTRLMFPFILSQWCKWSLQPVTIELKINASVSQWEILKKGKPCSCSYLTTRRNLSTETADTDHVLRHEQLEVGPAKPGYVFVISAAGLVSEFSKEACK